MLSLRYLKSLLCCQSNSTSVRPSKHTTSSVQNNTKDSNLLQPKTTTATQSAMPDPFDSTSDRAESVRNPVECDPFALTQAELSNMIKEARKSLPGYSPNDDRTPIPLFHLVSSPVEALASFNVASQSSRSDIDEPCECEQCRNGDPAPMRRAAAMARSDHATRVIMDVWNTRNEDRSRVNIFNARRKVIVDGVAQPSILGIPKAGIASERDRMDEILKIGDHIHSWERLLLLRGPCKKLKRQIAISKAIQKAIRRRHDIEIALEGAN